MGGPEGKEIPNKELSEQLKGDLAQAEDSVNNFEQEFTAMKHVGEVAGEKGDLASKEVLNRSADEGKKGWDEDYRKAKETRSRLVAMEKTLEAWPEVSNQAVVELANYALSRGDTEFLKENADLIKSAALDRAERLGKEMSDAPMPTFKNKEDISKYIEDGRNNSQFMARFVEILKAIE